MLLIVSEGLPFLFPRSIRGVKEQFDFHPVGGHLGYLQPGITMNKAAVNIPLQVFFFSGQQTYVFISLG